MDIQIFKKMRVKDGMSARVVNALPTYPENVSLEWTLNGEVDFLHLFVSSRGEFEKEFLSATADMKKNTLVWISYPKSSPKHKYDINRDSLWDLLIPKGWHPVSQVSLDEVWSTIRLKPNEAGQVYVRPESRSRKK